MSDQIVSASSATFAQVRAIQTEINTLEERITALLGQGNKLAYESGWNGPDRDKWTEDWEGQTTPKLKTTLDVLQSINANAKDSAKAISTAGGKLDFE